MKGALRAAMRALPAVAAGSALWGCLLQQPLARPEDAYDARAALRGDSLARFDTVEVWLEDAEDSSVVVRLWKGPLASSESLGAGAANGGRNIVYVVRGYRRDRGYCFVERKSRSGETLDLKDTCEAKETPPTPQHPAYARPHFLSRKLDLVDSAPGSVGVGDMPGFRITARASESWLHVQWEASGNGDSAEAVRDSVLRVLCRTWSLPAGQDSGFVVLDSDGTALDTLKVRLTVGTRFVRGKVVDWGAGAPQADIRVELSIGQAGRKYAGTTGGDGSYAIAVDEALPATYIARFSAAGRIGKIDSLSLLPGPEKTFVTALPPARSFRAVDLDSKLPTGSVAVAAGYGIVVLTPVGQEGKASLVRLDPRAPVFEKSIDLANNDGDPDLPEYFDAGELAADSQALYIAYPNDNRLGRIGGWRNSPEVKLVSVPLQPGGLLLDGDRLLTLGRLGDGTLALARYRAADLALLEVDTLKGFGWDGMLAERHSPKLVSGPGGYYAVDRMEPNLRGHVFLIGKEDGKVQDTRDLPDGEVDDLTWDGGLLYVGGGSAASRWLRGFRVDLSPADSIEVGVPVDRLASDAGGRFGNYAFATSAESDTVLVFAPFSGETLGRLPVAGGNPARSIALDPASRTVLVSDGVSLFSASF